jgi:hypothetical protein
MARGPSEGRCKLARQELFKTSAVEGGDKTFLTIPLFNENRLLSRQTSCDEYNHAKVHCMTLYKYSLLIPIRAFPSEGRTTWVGRYPNSIRVLMRIVLPVSLGTHKYAQ